MKELQHFFKKRPALYNNKNIYDSDIFQRYTTIKVYMTVTTYINIQLQKKYIKRQLQKNKKIIIYMIKCIVIKNYHLRIM